MIHHREINFYGTGTIGERGQIVIPVKARQKLKIKPGENFIFFGYGPIIHLVKSAELDSIFDRISQKFSQKMSKVKSFKDRIKQKL